MAIVKRHKKGSLSWFNSLTEDFQLELFRRWRRTSSDVRKSWCFNSIRADEGMVRLMLDELSKDICGNKTNYNFNNLDEPVRGGRLHL